MLNQARVEREIESKYRRVASTTSQDPTTQSRLSQLQYATSKFADLECAAQVMELDEQVGADVIASASAMRRSAQDGARALCIAMHAIARGPELGHDYVVRAASKALSKDLGDFNSLTGVSASLLEEFEKHEERSSGKDAHKSGASARPNGQQGTCYFCRLPGHVAAACPSAERARAVLRQQDEGAPPAPANPPA